jgi:predicted DNA-binding protein
MPHLTVEVLQLLEEKLGKEEAKKVAEAIEIALESIEDKAKEVAIQKKLELKEGLTKELITKAEFYGEIRLIKQEIEALRQEMRTLKTELEAKIENEILKLDRKFTILFLILLFAIIFLNKEALEVIAKLFGLIK